MLGVVGKLFIKYRVGHKEYEETFDLSGEGEYILAGCNECKIMIDEIYYVIDTIYGVSVYFDGNEEESILVSGNEYSEFEIKKYDIAGAMSIVMF